MIQLMLRAVSSAMTTAAVMLIGVAIVSGTSQAAPVPMEVCPAEPQNGQCVGTCQNPGDECTPGVRTFPDGTTRDICGCIPTTPPPDDPAVVSGD